MGLLDPGVVLGAATRRTGTRGSRPSTRPPRRTSGRTCAASRGSATTTRCRCARGRWRSSRWAGRCRRPRATVATVGRAATTSGRRSRARSMRAQHLHPAGIVEPQGAHHAVDDLEVVARAPRRRGRRPRARPAGSGRSDRRSRCRANPSGDGRNCGNDGFDAASSSSVRSPVDPSTRVVRASRVDALERRATCRRRCARRRALRTGTRRRSG